MADVHKMNGGAAALAPFAFVLVLASISDGIFLTFFRTSISYL